MDSRHRLIRSMLEEMSNERKAEYVRAFGLSPEEEAYILGRELEGKSCVQLGRLHHRTDSTVRKKRIRAFQHMADLADFYCEKGGHPNKGFFAFLQKIHNAGK